MLSDKEKELFMLVRKRVLDQIEYDAEVTDSRIEEMAGQYLAEEIKNDFLPYHRRILLGKEIYHSLRKLDILQTLIDNPSITEIMVNGPKSIYIEEKGRLYKLDKCFESEEKLKDIIQQIVAKCNRVVNDSSPIVDARLDDGSRINVVLNPVAINGPILTIRRFPQTPYDMQKLIEIGSLSVEAAEFLKSLVIAGYNILVSGGTGSGKTSPQLSTQHADAKYG